jgi:hypothetical protein
MKWLSPRPTSMNRIETVASFRHSEKNSWSMTVAPIDIENLDFAALTQEDREFLHDLANPLAIAGGLLESYREETARQKLSLSESQDRKLTKLANALDRIEKLISERRKRLVALQLHLKSDVKLPPKSKA